MAYVPRLPAPCDRFVPGVTDWVWVGHPAIPMRISLCFTCRHPSPSHSAATVETYSTAGPYLTAVEEVSTP